MLHVHEDKQKVSSIRKELKAVSKILLILKTQGLLYLPLGLTFQNSSVMFADYVLCFDYLYRSQNKQIISVYVIDCSE